MKQAQDGGIAAVAEGIALAGVEDGLELVVGQDGRQELGLARLAHLRHRALLISPSSTAQRKKARRPAYRLAAVAGL